MRDEIERLAMASAEQWDMEFDEFSEGYWFLQID